MSQAIVLNSAVTVPVTQEEKPCYSLVLERISLIWQAISAWISQLFAAPLPSNNDHFLGCPDGYRNVLLFLDVEEVAVCEEVCKAWKVADRVWSALCQRDEVSYALPERAHKEAFSNPRLPKGGFGAEEWKKYLRVDPGAAPRLPACIHWNYAQLKETHTLTLIPATVNGKQLTLCTFVHIAKESGVNLSMTEAVLRKCGRRPAGKSVWVWVEKEATRIIGRRAPMRDLIGGKTLWYAVSAVAHFARNRELLFSSLGAFTGDYVSENNHECPATILSFLPNSVIIGQTSCEKPSEDVGSAEALLA